MGRSPRVRIPGGIYHVYNRVSRGEHVFGDEGEAKIFLERLASTKRRDGFHKTTLPGTFKGYDDNG